MAAAEQTGTDVRIFYDVPGPKTVLILNEESTSQLTVRVLPWDEPATDDAAYVRTDGSILSCPTGQILYLGDGERFATVNSVKLDIIEIEVGDPAIPAGQYGITIAGDSSLGAATATPPARIRKALVNLGDQAIFWSFVDDVGQLQVIRDEYSAALWSKVESEQGCRHAAEIAAMSDGVLLGRGDLLMSVGPLRYARVEKATRAALSASGRPWIVGTQLLTASQHMHLPHRSELSYIGECLESGVGGFLLSDETTVGPEPIGMIELLASLCATA